MCAGDGEACPGADAGACTRTGSGAKAFERCAQLAGGLIAPRRRFVQGLTDHRVEPRRNARVEPSRGCRVLMQDRADKLRALGLRKSALAGGHFVEHRAGGENVAARVGALAGQLLRRHIWHGAGNGPGLHSDAAS